MPQEIVEIVSAFKGNKSPGFVEMKKLNNSLTVGKSDFRILSKL